MMTSLPASTDSFPEWPAKHAPAVVEVARRDYRFSREIDVEHGTLYALLDVALTDRDPAHTQETLRDILGGAAPERRWALAGEIARLGHALHRAPWTTAGRADRDAAAQALHRVRKEAAAAQVAGLRFLFGGAR